VGLKINQYLEVLMNKTFKYKDEYKADNKGRNLQHYT